MTDNDRRIPSNRDVLNAVKGIDVRVDKVVENQEDTNRTVSMIAVDLYGKKVKDIDGEWHREGGGIMEQIKNGGLKVRLGSGARWAVGLLVTAMFSIAIAVVSGG